MSTAEKAVNGAPVKNFATTSHLSSALKIKVLHKYCFSLPFLDFTHQLLKELRAGSS